MRTRHQVTALSERSEFSDDNLRPSDHQYDRRSSLKDRCNHDLIGPSINPCQTLRYYSPSLQGCIGASACRPLPYSRVHPSSLGRSHRTSSVQNNLRKPGSQNFHVGLNACDRCHPCTVSQVMRSGTGTPFETSIVMILDSLIAI
jgi:hypothetical protein